MTDKKTKTIITHGRDRHGYITTVVKIVTQEEYDEYWRARVSAEYGWEIDADELPEEDL